MKKELGPMAKLHYGPDNKATGNGKNSISSENMSKIAQNMASAGISGAAGGAIVEEYELEKEVKKQTGDFPQLSAQDYSQVQRTPKGENIIVKIKNK